MVTFKDAWETADKIGFEFSWSGLNQLFIISNSPMEIWSEFRTEQHKADFYREDAPDFTIKIGQFFISSIVLRDLLSLKFQTCPIR